MSGSSSSNALKKVFGEQATPERHFYIQPNGVVEIRAVGLHPDRRRELLDHFYEHLHERFDLPKGEGLTGLIVKGLARRAWLQQEEPATLEQWAEFIDRFGPGNADGLISEGKKSSFPNRVAHASHAQGKKPASLERGR